MWAHQGMPVLQISQTGHLPRATGAVRTRASVRRQTRTRPARLRATHRRILPHATGAVRTRVSVRDPAVSTSLRRRRRAL